MPPVQVVLVDRTLRAMIMGGFLIMAVGALYFAKDFLLPISLAFLFALVLSPVVRALARRRVPEGVSAVAIVLLALAITGSAAYTLSEPVTRWVADAPQIAVEVQRKLATLRRPVEAVVAASSEVENLTRNADPGVQKVVLEEPGLLSRAATGVPEAAAKIGLTLVLLLFLLASGDMFQEKLVKALPTLSDKKRALRIAREVEREVAGYLLTISLVNVGLGAAIAAGLWTIGMPNPILWGVVAALLNYIPYLGAVAGMLLVGAVALVSFETLGWALVAPAIYAVCNGIEGQFVTPMVIGRRLELNAVAVFTAVAFWGWLWGIVGALIAVPLLVTLKIFADHVEGLSALGEFLGARDRGPDEEKAAA